MKKLLTILGAVGLVATVVACSKNNKSLEYTFENNKRQLTKKDDTVGILITDFSGLTNVKATSSDDTVLTVAEPDQEEKVTVTAQANTGTAKVPIQVDAVEHDLLFLGKVTITITNVEALINPTAEIESSGLQIITIDKSQIKQGKILVTALSVIGQAQVIIGADNAVAPVIVKINVSLIP